MAKRWKVEVEKHIGADDKVQESCEGQLQGETGQLVLTRKRVLFVKEEGLFRKRVIIALDIPYPRIKRVLAEGQYKLTFTDVDEMRHSFIVMDTPAPKIEARLREFLKNRQAPQIPA